MTWHKMPGTSKEDAGFLDLYRERRLLPQGAVISVQE